MFSVTVAFLVLILGIQLEIKGLYARPSSDIKARCPSTGIPQGSQRGVNVIHGNKPVYKIDVGGLEKSGYEPGKQYEVSIKAQDPNRKFGDVLLWLQAESDVCKTGILEETEGLYLQPESCPHMVFKDTKPAEHRFSFKWTAPDCGCILVRARVEAADESEFFMEDETVVDGYLTKRVCPKQDLVLINKMTKQEKYKVLCEVTEDATADNLAKRSYVLSSRKVDFNKMPLIEQEAWIMVFDQKLFEVQQCCKMVLEEQAECFSDIRRHRIDRFCAYGESIVPFTTNRRDYMLHREEDCCWRLGEGRYHCFSRGPMMDGTGRHVDIVGNMDESDPVNDLEDFQTELSNKFNLRPKTNVQDDIKMSMNQNKEKRETQIDETTEDSDEEDYFEDDKSKTGETRDVIEDEQSVQQKKTIETTTLAILTTKTSEVLKRKLERTKTKIECCDLGKQYGLAYVRGDAWDRCESGAHNTAKAYKAGRRRCKNFYMRCCMENFKRSDVENDEKKVDKFEESEEDKTDEKDDNSQQELRENNVGEKFIDVEVHNAKKLLDEVVRNNGAKDKTKENKNGKYRKNQKTRKRRRRNKKKSKRSDRKRM